MVSLRLLFAVSMLVAPAATGTTVSIVSTANLDVRGFAGAPDASASGRPEIPAIVMRALITKFPQARIDKWTRETEGANEVYDIEFRQEGRKFEADISAAGTIQNWERQVAESDLPQAVVRAVAQRFPKAGMKEIMAVTVAANGTERLEGYEIVVRRGLRRDVEITIAPDGTVLEGGR